eukprot:2766939-Rhodomonas_salina.1
MVPADKKHDHAGASEWLSRGGLPSLPERHPLLRSHSDSASRRQTRCNPTRPTRAQHIDSRSHHWHTARTHSLRPTPLLGSHDSAFLPTRVYLRLPQSARLRLTLPRAVRK